MKRLFSILAVAVIAFAACTTDVTKDVTVEVPQTLTVSFEEDTRIQLMNGKTVWTTGDLVSVFYRSDANQQWKCQGVTGDRSGNLRRVSTPEATTKLSKVVAVYPYNKNYYINPETCNIEATLPAEQTYIKDSYGLDGNILVSASEFNQLYMRNVLGWLKIQLKGEGQVVKKITLKGNNSEQVAGLIYIDSSDATATLAAEHSDGGDDGVGGTLVFEDTILTEVALNCTEGVTLGSEATAFYIALPPQTFTKGLTIEIACSDGSVMTKSTENAIAIERNCIQPMAVINVISWKDLSTNGTANCYIVSEKGHYSFNATIIGNGQNGIIADAGFHTSSVSILPKSVSLLWDENSIVSDLHLNDGKVYFTASSNRGNALIAVKDSSDNIIWSWHIWATEKPKDYLSYDGYSTIDRNIGAISANYADKEATYGLYFQWGRKDPLRNPSTVVDTDNTTGNITYTIEHPTQLVGGNFYNWQYSNKSEYLWGYEYNTKTIYDPCPVGYKVPFPVTSSAAYIYDSSRSGGRWDGELWYPFAGRLSYESGESGEDDERGIAGFYYVNTYSNFTKNDTYDQYFSASRVLINNLQFKGYAESVRCIKE